MSQVSKKLNTEVLEEKGLSVEVEEEYPELPKMVFPDTKEHSQSKVQRDYLDVLFGLPGLFGSDVDF